MKQITIDDIQINITRKKIKNVNLSVHPPNGEVKLSVPLHTTDRAVQEFVISKLSWIKKHKAKFNCQEKPAKKNYISGEIHDFFGKEYKLNLIYIKRNPEKAEITDGGHINLYVKNDATKERREKIIKEWKRGELKLRITFLIQKWEKIMQVKVNEFGVKQMKTRWGTCNIQAKRIWINLELANKPPDCLEYIVVHEMVHLLERNHNEKFTAYMDQFLPNWSTIKAELNNYTS